jgi:hypothetical protein
VVQHARSQFVRLTTRAIEAVIQPGLGRVRACLSGSLIGGPGQSVTSWPHADGRSLPTEHWWRPSRAPRPHLTSSDRSSRAHEGALSRRYPKNRPRPIQSTDQGFRGPIDGTGGSCNPRF